MHNFSLMRNVQGMELLELSTLIKETFLHELIVVKYDYRLT
jgi:hypothetical protein